MTVSLSYGQEVTNQPAQLQNKVLYYPRPEADFDTRTGYPLSLLRQALKSSKALSVYQLNATDIAMPRGRSLKLLERGIAVGIFWSIATPERDNVLSKVDFDIYKGMFGYRLLIVNKENKAPFEKIRSVDVLKQKVAALGHDWPDYEILVKNGFNVQGTSSYSGLFKLLQKDRVDYLPRSIFEVWLESDHFRSRGMYVVEGIALYYPISFNYYLNASNDKLAELIQESLELMAESGDFDTLFNLVWKDSLERSSLDNKDIHFLHN